MIMLMMIGYDDLMMIVIADHDMISDDDDLQLGSLCPRQESKL